MRFGAGTEWPRALANRNLHGCPEMVSCALRANAARETALYKDLHRVITMARRRHTAVSVALQLALLLGIGYSSAYPVIWTGITQDCQAVPAASYGPHPAPVPDA